MAVAIEKGAKKGSLRAVTDLVTKLQDRPAQIVCPIDHPPGDEAQIDWGEVTVTLHYQHATFPHRITRRRGSQPRVLAGFGNGKRELSPGRLRARPVGKVRNEYRLDYDVDENGTINPLNVLAVVNFMNLKENGEGEDEDLQRRPAPNEVALEDASLLVAAYMQIEEKTCLVTMSCLGDSASLSLA